MKKNILYIFILSIFITSCEENATDIVQPGTIIESVAFQTVEDLELGLNGVYNAYNPHSQIRFNAIFTDNAKRGLASNGQQQDIFNFNINSNTGAAGALWNGRYAVINFANRTLGGVELVEFDESEQAQVNNIRGQLLALRSLAHFDLLQYFTPDYSNPQSLSAIYLDFVPTIDQQFERISVSEMFDLIKADLEQAENLVAEDNGTFFINKDVVKAIRARVALFEGDYQTALNFADELIAEYPLANQTDYAAIFQDTSQEEVIWNLSRVLGDARIGAQFFFNFAVTDADPYWEVSNELFNALSDSDIRKQVLIGPETNIVSTNSEDNVIILNKYPGDPNDQLLNDIKVFRVSEMHLIKAECEARLGNLMDAAQTIKNLRDVRFDNVQPLPSYVTLTEALFDILDERRLELAYEGHRFLDLKRIGADLNIGIDRLDVDAESFSAPSGLPRTDFRFTLPIPQSELNANNVITQNDGY